MAFLQKTSYKWIGLNNPDEIINDVDGFNIFKHFKSSVNAPDIEKDFVHLLQENGFSPVCVLMCCLRLLLSENDLEH